MVLALLPMLTPRLKLTLKPALPRRQLRTLPKRERARHVRETSLAG
jgi:hypothetical protein